MSLSTQYLRQYPFRPWPRIFELLPDIRGQLVLDLGCGVGDQTAELVARGATVIGVDADRELLATARGRGLSGATFVEADLAQLDLGKAAGGIWCSFVAAYLTDLSSVLERWRAELVPGGWILLTEVDDLFGHEPLPADIRALLDGYVADARQQARYDFRMGGKLRRFLEAGGFTVQRELELEDRELSFQGAAAPEVLAAWSERLERMQLLRRFTGAQFDRLRAAFLECLAAPAHRSTASVRCCLATL